MRIFRLGMFAIIIVVFGIGISRLLGEKTSLEKEMFSMKARVSALMLENQDLSHRIQYYEDPRNLIKELKSQFNYHEAGEKLIIIVPGGSSASSSSQ